MRQEQFLARYQHEWQQLEDWLEERHSHATEPMNAAVFPARYRRLCQHLALARARGYSPHLVQRLQHLMQRGHALLYRTRTPRLRRALEFLLADFPYLVRSQGRMMWIACALFCIPLIGSFVLLQYRPDMIHMLLEAGQIGQIESMYDPASRIQRPAVYWPVTGRFLSCYTTVFRWERWPGICSKPVLVIPFGALWLVMRLLN